MNPVLQQQLEILAQTLALRNNQPVTLSTFPKTGEDSTYLPPSRVPEHPPAPPEPVLRRDSAAAPIEEAVESFSARQVARVAADLNPLALRIYALLNRLGCEVAHRRGYNRKAGQASYFCPAELICAHLDISRGSFYRSLKELLALGLVDARGHKTTLNGWGVRCDGTLWSVKLLPHKGSRARLRYEDLKAQYRDLAADIEAGKTVWAQTRQSSTEKDKCVTLECLLVWALSPQRRQSPVTVTVASDEQFSSFCQMLWTEASSGEFVLSDAVDEPYILDHVL